MHVVLVQPRKPSRHDRKMLNGTQSTKTKQTQCRDLDKIRRKLRMRVLRFKYHVCNINVTYVFRETVAVLWDVMLLTEPLPRLALCLGVPAKSVPTGSKFIPGSQSILNG